MLEENLVYVADTFNHRIQVLALTIDLDGDGMEDFYEKSNGLNPDSAADANADADGDGVTNIGESRIGTNPQVADTDGDGESDLAEVNKGSTPLDPEFDILRLTTLTRLPAGMQVTFTGQAGQTYRVQYTDTLPTPDTSWLDLPSAGNPVVARPTACSPCWTMRPSEPPATIARSVTFPKERCCCPRAVRRECRPAAGAPRPIRQNFPCFASAASLRKASSKQGNRFKTIQYQRFPKRHLSRNP
jgi:hypothetical protein